VKAKKPNAAMAFDSISREKLMEILIAYGWGETDFFQIVAGVLQGDTLAPFLSVVALDYALR